MDPYTGISNQGGSGIPVYRPLRLWSYGPDASDQTHNMSINFTDQVPNASKIVKNPVVRYAFDDWMFSGIAQFVTGTPVAVAFTTTDGTDETGGGDGQHINVVGNGNANAHTFSQWFNTAAFARPGLNDPGNAASTTRATPVSTTGIWHFPSGSR
jgi:hypothetical protein